MPCRHKGKSECVCVCERERKADLCKKYLSSCMNRETGCIQANPFLSVSDKLIEQTVEANKEYLLQREAGASFLDLLHSRLAYLTCDSRWHNYFSLSFFLKQTHYTITSTQTAAAAAC